MIKVNKRDLLNMEVELTYIVANGDRISGVDYCLKRVKFWLGHYEAKLPSVTTHAWTVDNWVRWIDLEGVWK